MDLEAYNLHWLRNYRYGFPKKRDLYYELDKGIDKKRVDIITGLRRTGKTTLMKQLIDSLMEKGKEPENILYFSFDEPSADVRSVMESYESKIGKKIVLTDEFYYIFLDEIQKSENWAEQIKYYYDQYRNIKFVISGSASLFIRMGKRESLAGRTRELLLPPLSFREYLLFKGLEYLVEKPTLHEKSLMKEFEPYLYRQFIDVVNEDIKTVAEYGRSIIEKVIYIDIPNIFRVENPDKLLSIIKIISSNPGMLLDYISLGKNLGINRATVSGYIHSLSQSYLLKIGYNYSKSAVKSERKLKKAYLSTPSFSNLYPPSPVISKLVEWHFFIDQNVNFFWRTPHKDEVDIINTHNKFPIPVEVKYRNEISSSETRSVRKFMRHFGIDSGIIITKDIEDKKIINEGELEFIPAWKAALRE